MSLNPAARDSLIALANAINPPAEEETAESTETVSDFVNKLLAEPDKKRRKVMMKDFAARRADVAKFINEYEDLINAEAEMALIGAAVGATVTEKEVSYKGGKRQISTKERHIAPNVGALNLYLKNKMPEKYSDKPMGEIEIEDTADIEEALYENGNTQNEGG